MNGLTAKTGRISILPSLFSNHNAWRHKYEALFVVLCILLCVAIVSEFIRNHTHIHSHPQGHVQGSLSQLNLVLAIIINWNSSSIRIDTPGFVAMHLLEFDNFSMSANTHGYGTLTTG